MEFNISLNQIAPLSLAYVGDAVYEIYVRTRLVEEHPTMPAHKLHIQSIKYVKAHAQHNRHTGYADG